ncbi:MAG: prepilin-type N-terminal cleavage/methylation domain-containing protein [Anaerolineae bacterium]|nr:prepilin-type N-terminal cleavage/methylation domain-containing protein [Phycisphaerae bacterium]
MFRGRRAFSLIELVMVVVIIAVIGAIAIPRLSRGSVAAAESALRADLVALNKAIDHYAAEHDGSFPDVNAIAAQLTMFTNAGGATSSTASATHVFGPYIRSIPPQPVGTRKESTGIAAANGAGVGWIYDAAVGTIQPAGTKVGGAPIMVGGAVADGAGEAAAMSEN